jgi:hypothetical protein
MPGTLFVTIGTLGILVSLAAKFGKPSAHAMACDAAGRDRLHATVSVFPSMHSNRPPVECEGEHRKRHEALLRISIESSRQRTDPATDPSG